MILRKKNFQYKSSTEETFVKLNLIKKRVLSISKLKYLMKMYNLNKCRDQIVILKNRI